MGIFFVLKNSVIDGNCAGDEFECRSLAQYAVYLWRLWDFSLAVFAIGILSAIKPVANKVLLIVTVCAAFATAAAVSLAPELSGNFLSPFDKKFVGEICLWAYVLIAFAIWAWSLRKQLKKAA